MTDKESHNHVIFSGIISNSQINNSSRMVWRPQRNSVKYGIKIFMFSFVVVMLVATIYNEHGHQGNWS